MDSVADSVDEDEDVSETVIALVSVLVELPSKDLDSVMVMADVSDADAGMDTKLDSVIVTAQVSVEVELASSDFDSVIVIAHESVFDTVEVDC